MSIFIPSSARSTAFFMIFSISLYSSSVSASRNNSRIIASSFPVLSIWFISSSLRMAISSSSLNSMRSVKSSLSAFFNRASAWAFSSSADSCCSADTPLPKISSASSQQNMSGSYTMHLIYFKSWSHIFVTTSSPLPSCSQSPATTCTKPNTSSLVSPFLKVTSLTPSLNKKSGTLFSWEAEWKISSSSN